MADGLLIGFDYHLEVAIIKCEDLLYCVFHNPVEKLKKLSWIYAMGCLKGHKKFGQSNNIIIDALVIPLLLGNTVWSVSSISRGVHELVKDNVEWNLDQSSNGNQSNIWHLSNFQRVIHKWQAFQQFIKFEPKTVHLKSKVPSHYAS